MKAQLNVYFLAPLHFLEWLEVWALTLNLSARLPATKTGGFWHLVVMLFSHIDYLGGLSRGH